MSYMKTNILKACKIEVKIPNECSEQELNNFYIEVKKGGKVKLQGIQNRIKNCELLAFCYIENKLVGVSSIKKPNSNYVDKIIRKSKIERKVEDLNFEIGYSFTGIEFRRNGISQKLKEELLKKMESRKGIIFSTTAIKSSQNFLEQNGFKKYGYPYDGENDKEIIYYEKVIQSY